MDIHGKMTLGQLTEQLKDYLKKFGQGLGIDDDEDKGARGEMAFCTAKYNLFYLASLIYDLKIYADSP